MIFVFAGHDTTSSTICYIFHKLSYFPEKMVRARQELDEIFGTNLDDAPKMLAENPHLMNKMEYCTAIIREVLRMYPPASSVRAGVKGYINSLAFLRTNQKVLIWMSNVQIFRQR